MNMEPLRSLQSREKTVIRFINLSERVVDIIWIDFMGRYVKYGELRANNSLIINTYKTHPWIAADSKRRDRLYINHNFVYMPQLRQEFVQQYGHLQRIMPSPTKVIVTALITLPMFSLRYLTLLELRALFKEPAEVANLDLPNVLIETLSNLIEERNNLPWNACQPPSDT